MYISFRERIKGYVGTIFLASIVIFSISMFMILYPLMADPDYYKNIILTEVNSKSGLSFDYKESTPTFFPFPGIELSQVTVSKNQDQLIRVQKVKIEIYHGVFIGKALQIRRIYLNTGKIELKREKNESFPLFAKLTEKKKEGPVSNVPEIQIEEKLLFSDTFGGLPKGLELKNIMIEFDDELYSRKIKFYIWESSVEIDKDLRSLDFYLYGKVNDDTFQIYTNASFIYDEMNFENLRVEGSAHFDEFRGSNLQDILVIFPNADCRNGKFTGVMPFYKRTNEVIASRAENVNIKDLALKGKSSFGDAYISVLIEYNITEKKLSFSDISAEWKGKIKIFGAGYVTFGLVPQIYFEGRSDYLEVDSTLNIIKLWLDADLEKSIITRDMPDTKYVDRMHVNLDFNLRRVNIRGIFADEMNLALGYHKSLMKIKRLNLALYKGKLVSTGNVTFGTDRKLIITGKAENIALGDILFHQFGNSPITGTLETNFELNSQGFTERELTDNLNINAAFKSKDGELLSYTNILKPISSIGNLISLKKLDFTRATPYKEIDVDMNYASRKFQFSNFILKADGIAGSGSGSITIDKKIDMQFTVALPGLAGKVLKLPIIYKGTYGTSTPYIDPVWLGSVYAGTILLAGPAGATVGGIAGSAMSDYVNRAVDNVTDTIGSGIKSFRNLFSNEDDTKIKTGK
ncbi:membrane biogenesis protein AsmA [Leptospira kobayashii]|uniref:Membrane biogenesis protein AsmA n=1 Tax=Leptospira kobayashii TaxID=1917830 RepID=A0ABN6K9V1_9LEPT|nr:AsmA family protein [Leptospira kobayashii]BDA77356.1 membrane biogenesis protein AsmA [Leptospira kobayashii]